MSARTILDEIAEFKRREVAGLRETHSLFDELKQHSAASPPARDFKVALAAEGLSLIGEIKHASPSAGIIREDFTPSDLAPAYERGGARALSVLTDQKYFKGSLEDLQSARAAVALPVLRKDFVLDEIQILQARCAGADAILLIVRMLDSKELSELLAAARSAGLAALVETHDREELARALDAGADIVGINNRDLAHFTTDIETTISLAESIPDDVVLVSESGIKTREDLSRLQGVGVDAVLIGETFMRAADVEAKVRELMARQD